MTDSANPMDPVPGTPKKRNADLGVRTISAIVMVAVAVGAYLADGYPWMLFVGAIGIALLWEYWGLVRLMTDAAIERVVWLFWGLIYFGLALFMAIVLSSPFFGRTPILVIVGSVIATDVGAYFAGRTFGGPKIAPKISPSKTWSGLAGGMICSALVFVGIHYLLNSPGFYDQLIILGISGALLAVVAQAGDFFESWMKRRAGVKDSGRLIPGHGGVFDRTDGLIAVLFVTGILFMGTAAYE